MFTLCTIFTFIPASIIGCTYLLYTKWIFNTDVTRSSSNIQTVMAVKSGGVKYSRTGQKAKQVAEQRSQEKAKVSRDLFFRHSPFTVHPEMWKVWLYWFLSTLLAWMETSTEDAAVLISLCILQCSINL